MTSDSPWQLVLLGPKFRGQTGLGGESLFWNGLETRVGACWGVGTGNRGWQGHTQDAAPALTGQGSHLGVLMGGLPVLLPKAGVGPGAFPKHLFRLGEITDIWLGLPLPSPPPWTRCFLGFPAPEEVISQGLKNMALNHNLTRTKLKGQDPGNTYRMTKPSLGQQAPLLSGCVRLGLLPPAPPKTQVSPTKGQRHGSPHA